MEANIHWTKISRQFSERVFVVAEIELWSNALTLHWVVWEGVALHFHNGWQASDDQHKMRHNGLPASQQLGRSGRMMHWRDGEGGQGGHRRYVERIVTMKCNFVLLLYKLHWVKYLDVSCPYNDAPKLSIMAVVAYGLTQQCFSYSVWLRETADSSHRVSLRSQLQNASGLRMIINILCSSLMRPAHWAVLNTLLGTCVSLCNLFT